MEQDGKEAGSVSRSQNVVYVVPHDTASLPFFLAPLIERIDESARELQLLILTTDAEAAVAIGVAAMRLATDRSIGIMAATSVARTTRLLKVSPSQVIVGSPATILELMRASAIKLTTVRAVAFAWADTMLEQPAVEEMIGLVLADVDKDAARTVATTEVTPAVENLIERYARRARRVTSSATGDTTPIAIEYATSTEPGKLASLRRVLDALDVESASIFVRTEEYRPMVDLLLRSLGYGGPNAPVHMSHAGGTAGTVVLYDLPASRMELTEAMGSAKRVIALIQPRQLTSLRGLAASGRVRPITFADAVKRGRDRDELMRTELRSLLERGAVGRGLIALEPLLEDFDGVEIAAAALELLEQERSKPRAAPAEAAPQAAGEGMTRLFFSVGMRDGLKTGEIVATIGNDAGVPSANIGKIDIRESHAIVEVGSSFAGQVVERLTGKSMSGRRVVVRPDQDAGERPSGGTRGRDAGAKRRPPRSDAPRRGDGPPRGRPAGDRDRPRRSGGDRP